MVEQKMKFEILRHNPVIRIDRTNYFISEQKIINLENNNESIHFVIKKQGVNDDGSLRGQTRQIFIPIDDSDTLFEACLNFLKKK